MRHLIAIYRHLTDVSTNLRYSHRLFSAYSFICRHSYHLILICGERSPSLNGCCRLVVWHSESFLDFIGMFVHIWQFILCVDISTHSQCMYLSQHAFTASFIPFHVVSSCYCCSNHTFVGLAIFHTRWVRFHWMSKSYRIHHVFAENLTVATSVSVLHCAVCLFGYHLRTLFVIHYMIIIYCSQSNTKY